MGKLVLFGLIFFLLPLSGLGHLDALVEDEVHEGVEAPEHALNVTTAVDLQADLNIRNKFNKIAFINHNLNLL